MRGEEEGGGGKEEWTNTKILHPACDVRTQTSSTPPNKQ